MRFRSRLTLVFGLFAFLLCTLFAILLAESLTTVEDEIVSSLLRQEASYLLSRHQESPEQLVMPDLNQLRGYLSGQPNLPQWLEPLDTGFHQTEEYHVLVQNLGTDQRIYLVYDEASGMLDRHEVSLWLILALLVLLVSAVGLGLGFYQASVLARPINKLAAQVQTVNTDDPEIIPLPGDDEIGLLSRAYADLVERLGLFIQREKAFTRYASHELMTPVSIINSNLELLQNENVDAEMRDRAIGRLQQATKHMQRQIEIFLMLAREDQLEASLQPLDWNSLWDTVRGQFPNVTLALNISCEPEVFVNEAVVQAILFNILSNVVKHGSPQRDAIDARLALTADSLEIANAVSRADQPGASSYGFGLEINKKLCEAVGWRFATREENGEFIVTVDFDAVADENEFLKDERQP